MGTQLSHAARVQLASSLRRRYQTASSKKKKLILSEFIAVSGYHPNTPSACSTKKTLRRHYLASAVGPRFTTRRQCKR